MPDKIKSIGANIILDHHTDGNRYYARFTVEHPLICSAELTTWEKDSMGEVIKDIRDIARVLQVEEIDICIRKPDGTILDNE